MRVDLLVRKERVLHDAGALCAYVARSLDNENAALAESDNEATNQIWDAGVASMETALREWLGCQNVLRQTQNEDWHGVIDMPENFEMAVVGALEASLHQYMTQFMAWKWLELHSPDSAGKYATGAATALTEANALLSQRHRPEEDVIVRRCGRVNRAMVIIDTESVILDVRSKAWIVSDVTPLEEGAGESRHQTADIGSGANIALLRRDIDLAWHEVEDMFYALIDHDDGCCEMMASTRHGCCHHQPEIVDIGVVDNAAPHVITYEMKLLLPVGVTESTVRYWRTLIHEYIVSYALASWFAIVNPERQVKFLADVERLREQLRSSMTRRIYRVHRPGRPF